MEVLAETDTSARSPEQVRSSSATESWIRILTQIHARGEAKKHGDWCPAKPVHLVARLAATFRFVELLSLQDVVKMRGMP